MRSSFTEPLRLGCARSRTSARLDGCRFHHPRRETRHMKRIGATAVIVFGLAAASIAVAHGTESKAVKQVSATFAATTASDVHTTTCTGADGDSYALSRGTY